MNFLAINFSSGIWSVMIWGWTHNNANILAINFFFNILISNKTKGLKKLDHISINQTTLKQLAKAYKLKCLFEEL